MSFAEDVKDELARNYPPGAAARKAEMTALLRMGGALVRDGGGIGLQFDTYHNATARKMWTYLKEIGGLSPRVGVRRGKKLRKKNVYRLMVPPGPQGQQFLAETGLIRVDEIPDADIFRSRDERRAYICGAFLGGGSVNHPQGDYHLELVTQSAAFARVLVKMLKTFKLTGRIVERKNDYIVYLKDGESVAELLRVMSASVAVMEFENVRIMKDMRNQVNRVVNCETANLQKTVDAAWEQLQDIECIRRHQPLSDLPPKLREAAELRLAHPDASLRELAAMAENGITKSGLYHRYRKLAKLAADYAARK